MRDLGMHGMHRGRKHRTTIPAKDGKRAGDLLDRNFTAEAPNLVWVADFMYCRTWAGFVYASFIDDVYALKIVAWHAATTKTTPLVLTPLRMALWQLGRNGHPVLDGQLMHHDDAGSHYTSVKFTERLALEGIALSIRTVGDSFDNALTETIFGLFKAECIDSGLFHQGPFNIVAIIKYATAGRVDWWNNGRLHGILGRIGPSEVEEANYAAISIDAAQAPAAKNP